jgi:hypothetical protein
LAVTAVILLLVGGIIFGAAQLMRPVRANQTPGQLVFNAVGRYKVAMAASSRTCIEQNSVATGHSWIDAQGRMCFIDLRLEPDATNVVYASFGFHAEAGVNTPLPNFNMSFNALNAGTYTPTNVTLPASTPGNQALRQSIDFTEYVRNQGSGRYQLENRASGGPIQTDGPPLFWAIPYLIVVQESPAWDVAMVTINDSFWHNEPAQTSNITVDMALPVSQLPPGQGFNERAVVRSFFGTIDADDVISASYHTTDSAGQILNSDTTFSWTTPAPYMRRVELPISAQSAALSVTTHITSGPNPNSGESGTFLVIELGMSRPVAPPPIEIDTNTCYDDKD